MQTIEFLRDFIIKGLEIHSSFLSYFSIFFSKKFNFQISK
jgi:hypothetical protein